MLSRLLLSEGVRLFRKEGRDAIVDMLSTCNPEKEIILVSRTGWNDLSSKEKLYACPNGVILCENPDVLIELSTVQESTVALKSGTLEEWKETVRLGFWLHVRNGKSTKIIFIFWLLLHSISRCQPKESVSLFILRQHKEHH